jgi:hypothetical protein
MGPPLQIRLEICRVECVVADHAAKHIQAHSFPVFQATKSPVLTPGASFIVIGDFQLPTTVSKDASHRIFEQLRNIDCSWSGVRREFVKAT